MDWALDDILMGDFQIPPSPPIQISQEPFSNSSDNKDEGMFIGESGSNPSMPIHGNESTSLPQTASTCKPSSGSSNIGNDEPDYVSELHQLLSEEDESQMENSMLGCESISHHFTSNEPPRNVTYEDNQTEVDDILKGGNETEVESATSVVHKNPSIESSSLPLLLSPPPAYRDEIGDLSFIISPTYAMESQSTITSNTIDRSIHSDLSRHGVSYSKHPLPVPPQNFNTTISVGDTFLTISPASVATSPLTSNTAFSSSNTKKVVPPLPFSVTRLPGGTILHSTTIKPAKSSSNSFSFLPITPLTASTISTTTTTTNSPLLLKALTPTRTLDNNFVSSPLSITPISTPFNTDTIGESGSQIKRFRSQSTLSFVQDPVWKKDDDFKDVVQNKMNENQVLSAPPSVETSCTNVHHNSKLPSNISLPINSIRNDLSESGNALVFDSEINPKSIISLPPALMSTNCGQQLLNDLKPQKLPIEEDKVGDKDPNFEAASKLAESFEALQNSATPQAGESSVDLMNALSLSILPVHEDFHPTSAFRPIDPNTLTRQNISYGPLVSSDMSLSSNKSMGNSNSTAILASNSIASKCTLNILSENNLDGSTISIRPIWKEKEIISSEKSVSKTAWDSAVVAQLGTLTPCAPPPISSQGAIKSSISKNISAAIIPPPPLMTNVSVGLPTTKCKSNQSQVSLTLTSPVLPINYESASLQNELSCLSSSRQPLSASSMLLPPPPYPSSSLPSSNSNVPSRSTFSTIPQTLRVPAAMSEADSGVESIDSLSPKDVSPISSPSTSAGPHSESMVSNSIIPPPPVSFSSYNSSTNIGTSNIEAHKLNRFNGSGIEDIEKTPTYQTYSDKEVKGLLSLTEINLDKPIDRGSIDNLKVKNQISPNASNASKSVLSTLLSTVPKPTKSSELLSNLLNNHVSSPTFTTVPPLSVLPYSKELVSSLSSSSNMSLPQTINPNLLTKRSSLKRSLSVIAINPNDMILSKEEKSKAKMREFLKESTNIDDIGELNEHIKVGVDNVDESNASLVDEPILRSALEDMDTSICQPQQRLDFNLSFPSSINKRKNLDVAVHSSMHIMNNNKGDVPKLTPSNTQASIQPSKQESFDCMMIEQGQKLVSTWDSDLHLRLKQLDSELDQAKQDNSTDGLLNINVEQEGQDNKHENGSSAANLFQWDFQLNPNPTFANKANTTAKASSNNGSPNTSVRTLLCPYCDEEFESNAARNDHKRKVHGRRNLCVPCDMVFASSTKLERHLLTHKGTKDHQCHICGKAFMIERNLILHQKLHLGQRDYVCDICGKSYFTKSGLLAHQKQNHSPPNESNCGDESYVEGSGFVCKDKKCEKRHFATRYDLDQHRKLDHKNDTNEETLKCVNCDATFKSSTQLKRHTANAHCSRPFKCPHCPHRSKNKVNLERHVAFHTSNKDAFQCLHCERKFAFKNSMKKHLEKGRCTVLKELEKAQKANNNGAEVFKNFLEATIMRHLQQTPKSPVLPVIQQAQSLPSVQLQNNLSNNYHQQQLTSTGPNIYSIIQGNNNDVITSMDTSQSSSYSSTNFTAPTSNLVSTLSSPNASSSSISSYINTASAICSDRNLQSVMPVLGNNENNVPNDMLYQFDTSTSSCNSINN